MQTRSVRLRPYDRVLRLWPLVGAISASSLGIGLALLTWSGPSVDVVAWCLWLVFLIPGSAALAVWFAITDRELRSMIPLGSPLAILAGTLAWLPQVRITDFFLLILGFYWVVWGFVDVAAGINVAGRIGAFRLAVGVVQLVGGAVLVSMWNDSMSTAATGAGLIVVLLGVGQAWLASHLRGLRT